MSEEIIAAVKAEMPGWQWPERTDGKAWIYEDAQGWVIGGEWRGNAHSGHTGWSSATPADPVAWARAYHARIAGGVDQVDAPDGDVDAADADSVSVGAVIDAGMVTYVIDGEGAGGSNDETSAAGEGDLYSDLPADPREAVVAEAPAEEGSAPDAAPAVDDERGVEAAADAVKMSVAEERAVWIKWTHRRVMLTLLTLIAVLWER